MAIAALTAGIVGFGAVASATIKDFAVFQSNIQNAKATLGLFGEEGRAAGQQLQALAQSPALTALGFNSNEAAKAIEELGSRGLETSDILNGGLNTAATLAAASGVKDLSISAEILVGTMRAFGIEGKEAAAIPDILANAANVSALKLDDFRLAIAAGGSAARTAGVDVTEFTAVMSLMRDRLIGASDAGTSFKSFSQALTPNTKDAAAEMRKLGFNAFDSGGKMKSLRDIVENLADGLAGYTDEQKLATLEMIFGSDGIRTATTLLDAYNTVSADGVRALDARTDALKRQGIADLAAKERTDSLAAAQLELANKILILKQRIGEELLPAAMKIVDSFTAFVDRSGDLKGAVSDLRDTIILLGTALVVMRRQAIAAWAVATWVGIAGAATGVAGLTTAVAALGAALGGIPGILIAVTAALALWAKSAINEIQRVQEQVAQSENDSTQQLLKKVAELNAKGDALSRAQAKYLLAQRDLSNAQQGTPEIGFFGEITYKPDPEAVKQAQLNFDAAKASLEAARVAAGNGGTGTTVLSSDPKALASAFLEAIFQQESASSGGYSAFNTDPIKKGQGAVGKYQVMPFNFVDPTSYQLSQFERGAYARNNMDTRGPKGFGWDYQATGRDYTIRELLGSPEAQEKIAQYQLGRYLEEELKNSKGDVEGAVKAAAKRWYGTGSTNGPTPDQYAASVWAKYVSAMGGANPLAGQGPLLPGQQRTTDAGVGYQLAAAQQALVKTGQNTADMLVDYCAQWVRLTLGKADKRVEPFVNKLFQMDRDGNGQTDARDAAAGAKAAGLLKAYTGPQDLKPGDTVFYTDGGQNHAGIYIGNGMVRGNNRVTYQDRGGRFGPGGIKSGTPLDTGRIDPVGNVAIDRLGKVTGVLRASDLAAAAGASSAPTAPAARGPASSDALKAEATRLLKALEQAKKDGNVDRILQVEGFIKRFEGSGERAAAALDLMRSKIGQTAKEVSKFGQGYDRLSRQLGDAENTFKLDQNAQAYAKGLDGIAAAALKAAQAEKAANGETEKYTALRKLAADATDKARQQRESDSRAAEQDRREQERKDKEAKALRTQAAQQGQELSGLLRDGRLKDAERVVAGLKRSQQQELELAGDNAAKRLEITNRTSPAILAAERSIANQTRDIAVKAARTWADAENEKARSTLTGGALRARLQEIEQVRVAKVRDAYADASASIQESETANANAVRQASTARTQALDGLKQQYQSTIDTFAKKLTDGTLTDEDLAAYWKELSAGLASAKKAGLDLDPAIVALRNQSRALAQEAPGVMAWAAAFTEAQAAANARYGNAGAVMDYSLRGSYGVGQAGYEAALAGYGVRSIDELEQYNEVAAASMRRVYAGVLAQMERDMADAVERAVNILEYYRSEADRIADQVATDADLATGRRDQEDATRVQDLSNAGPGSLLNFLGGPENSSFGERYWTDLGEQGRANFTEALNRVTPEQFSGLGVAVLRGIRDQIGDSPEWADLVKKLDDSIAVAQSGGSRAEGFSDLGKVFEQFGGLDARAAGYADTLRTKLIPELTRIRDATADAEVRDMADKAIASLTGEVDAARQLADLAIETRLNNLDTQRALGSLSERAYLQQRQVILIEQETARYRQEIQGKSGLELELAEAQHQQRLGQIIAGGLIASTDLTTTLQGELRRSQQELNQAITGSVPAYQSQIAALEALKKKYPEATAEIDKLIGAYTDLQTTERAAAASRDLQRAQDELNQTLGLSLPAYQAQIAGLEELKKKYPELTAEIDKLLGRYRELQKADPLVQGLKSASQILGKSSPLQAGLSSVTDGLAAFFEAGGPGGGKGAILKGAASLVGGLTAVFKTGDEDIDRVTNTFVSGLQGTLMQLAQGNWIGALVAGVATVVSTIVDIFVGGANSAKKAREQISQAADGIKFFDTSQYAKVESRGGFWGWLGFKKATIDQEALDIARTLGDALYDAISTGMLDGIKAGKTSFSDLGIDIRKSLADDILKGLIDGFLQGEVMKNIIQPFLDRYIAAKKSGDAGQLASAAAGLQQAVVQGNAELAAFYQNVLVPTGQQLGVFGSDNAEQTGNLGGNASVDLGLASAPTAVAAAPAYLLEHTAALKEHNAILRQLEPTLKRIADEGVHVEAESHVELRSFNDLRSYALHLAGRT
ncbi:phage tail tape measure protein [Deinococcus sp. 6GRE01]|uniref:phage tail tape measure protein n=1 Tax=Deinococcus sp. 6GRE01 TaxID=2745873 RepID=UPI001E28CE51